MKALSDVEFKQKVKDKLFSELGNYFWEMFLTLKIDDPERIKACAQFDTLSKRQQRLLEQL